jgi:HEAT repeat protein
MDMLGRFELSDQRDQAVLRLSSRSDLVGNWAIHLLVRRQYPPALVQLGKMLADPERAREAVDLLTTAGPIAESYVWPSLKEESLFTRRRACQVLERIGTAQSLPHLEPLVEDPLVGEDAKKAIEAIDGANRDPVSLKSDTEKSDAENANAPDPPRKAEEDTK